MRLRHFLWLSGLALCSPVWAGVEESTTTVVSTSTVTDVPETQQTTLSEEAETKGVIPADTDTLLSTRPITPTSVFPEKKPYEQAKDELVRAYMLWDKGYAEAASDTALEAYDDFIDLRRVPGVKRTVIREQARQAAKLYVQAGITYIKGYVNRMGASPEAIEEGRARMEDLRDVARNYPDQNKMLNAAIASLYGANPAKKK